MNWTVRQNGTAHYTAISSLIARVLINLHLGFSSIFQRDSWSLTHMHSSHISHDFPWLAIDLVPSSCDMTWHTCLDFQHQSPSRLFNRCCIDICVDIMYVTLINADGKWHRHLKLLPKCNYPLFFFFILFSLFFFHSRGSLGPNMFDW